MTLKAVNVMHFVRQCEPRWEDVDKRLFPATKQRIQMVKELDIENTFLLQYDTLCDSKYIDLFKSEKNDKMEIGLWYEIVKDMTDVVGLPYRSDFQWTWDYHIIPGFSMGYTQEERRLLIDEAMRKFKSVFGYYPKTVASWLIDTYTLNYLTEHYNISAIGICRDQMNIDAYTLHGGYFNQAYYPSKNNIFTPAQSREQQVKVPVFRLLGANPITNYDGRKYRTKKNTKYYDVTLEPGWGIREEIVDWFYKTYYGEEDMGFSYAQIGQENGFNEPHVVPQIRMEIEKALQLEDVKFLKMCDTGEWFKQQYPDTTPVTSVCAMKHWDDIDVQSVYYDSKYYVANLFRYEQKIFLRSLFLFDEFIEDKYMNTVCDIDYAVYENLPMVDTKLWDDGMQLCGMYFDYQGEKFIAKKLSDTQLMLSWSDKAVKFDEHMIEITGTDIEFYTGKAGVDIQVQEQRLNFEYLGHQYTLNVKQGKAVREEQVIHIMRENEKIILDFLQGGVC